VVEAVEVAEVRWLRQLPRQLQSLLRRLTLRRLGIGLSATEEAQRLPPVEREGAQQQQQQKQPQTVLSVFISHSAMGGHRIGLIYMHIIRHFTLY
jgi:hypothetical protein